MVVCIPRVFSVRAFTWWWVYLSLLDGGVVFVWFELFSFSFFSSCEWVGFILSIWLVLGVFGVVLVCVGPKVSSIVVMLRACAVGGGCHAWHWNMFSWLGCGTSGFRCLAVVRLSRGEVGGLILGFEGLVVVGVVGVGVCGVVSELFLAFFLGGFVVRWGRRSGGEFVRLWFWSFVFGWWKWSVVGWVLACHWRWVVCVCCGVRVFGKELSVWW